MLLQEFQARWISLWQELDGDPLFSSQISPPFLSSPPADIQRHPRIMYVGRATKGWDYPETAPGLLTAELQVAQTANFIRDQAQAYGGGFWPFARRVYQTITGSTDLSGLIWSNLLKIGGPNGNPSQTVGDKQYKLASETIREEIAHYRPDIVVFATGCFWHTVITDQFKLESWVGSDPNDGRSRIAQDGWPPMFWCGHPQGASKDTLERWAQDIKELIQS